MTSNEAKRRTVKPTVRRFWRLWLGGKYGFYFGGDIEDEVAAREMFEVACAGYQEARLEEIYERSSVIENHSR